MKRSSPGVSGSTPISSIFLLESLFPRMDVISISVVFFPHPPSCFLICSGKKNFPTPCQSKSNCEIPSIVRSCDSLSLETSPPGKHLPSSVSQKEPARRTHSKQHGGWPSQHLPKIIRLLESLPWASPSSSFLAPLCLCVLCQFYSQG